MAKGDVKKSVDQLKKPASTAFTEYLKNAKGNSPPNTGASQYTENANEAFAFINTSNDGNFTEIKTANEPAKKGENDQIPLRQKLDYVLRESAGKKNIGAPDYANGMSNTINSKLMEDTRKTGIDGIAESSWKSFESGADTIREQKQPHRAYNIFDRPQTDGLYADFRDRNTSKLTGVQAVGSPADTDKIDGLINRHGGRGYRGSSGSGGGFADGDDNFDYDSGGDNGYGSGDDFDGGNAGDNYGYGRNSYGSSGGDYYDDGFAGGDDIFDYDSGGGFAGGDGDDYDGEGDDYDEENSDDYCGGGDWVSRPLKILLRFFYYFFSVIKWALIYMGRFAASVFKTALVIILVVAFGVAGAGVGAIYGYIQDIEPVTTDMVEMKIQSSYIYDANGNQLAKLTGSGNINRQLVRYNDISPHLPRALIAIEDKRFESHNGIDPKRIVGAGLKFILGGSDAYDASTITQQLVKNITGKKDETLERKVQEWFMAIELEKTMEKWKILELYLNVVYFGNSCYGVSSASRTYFGKSAGELSLAESAFLVGITNSPGLYNPFSVKGFNNARDRQYTILSEMFKQGMISQEEYFGARSQKLNIIPKTVTTAVTSKPHSYFVDCVIEEVKKDLMAQKGMTSDMAIAQIYNYGLKIYTTLNPSVQASLDNVFNDPSYFPRINPDANKNNEQPQGAMVILDPNTAQIKAIVGGYGEKLADRTFNRATQARRQPGSSIKPIAVYGPAIDQRVITAASVVDDAPTHLDPNNPERVYPKNSTDDFRGLTTVRNAIRRSVNVIAAKTWLRIPDTSHIYLDKAGINRYSETQVALSLGGLHKGVTPLEMAAAYVPYVNRGMYYEPTTYTKVLDSSGRVILDKSVRAPVIVYSEQTAYIMTSMLEDVIKSGTGTTAALFDGKFTAAGKTGTTNDNADRWFVGYTPYYVASTWYGYDNKIKKIALTREELSNAMLIWRAVMEKIHEGLDSKEFAAPDQIVTATACIYSGKAPGPYCKNDPRGNALRTEMYIRGTEPRETDTCDVHVQSSVCATGSNALGSAVSQGPYCPINEVETRVSIRREVPFTPLPGDRYPSDWPYEYASQPMCPYHTVDGIAPQYATPEEEGGEEGDGGAEENEFDATGAQNSGPNQQSDDSLGETGDPGSPTRPIRTPRPDRRPTGTTRSTESAPRRTPR